MDSLTFKKINGGYTLELSPLSGIILSLQDIAGHRVALNDIVVSNGNIGPSKDTQGRVIEILEPGTQGHSSDVILCDFNGEVSFMKFGDLEHDRNGHIFHPAPGESIAE